MRREQRRGTRRCEWRATQAAARATDDECGGCAAEGDSTQALACAVPRERRRLWRGAHSRPWGAAGAAAA